MRMPMFVLAACCAALLTASCGSSDDAGASDPAKDTAITEEGAGGVRVVPAADALAIQTNPPADLVVLDVRTADEFNSGHLEGAVMLDFYDPDFAAQIADLDPDVPYLLYCQSGNRSGQTAEIMEQLGFTDVADVGGGILAWADAGQPIITE